VLVVATIFIIVRSVRSSGLLPDPLKPPATAVGANTAPANGAAPATGANSPSPATPGAPATAPSGDALIATFQPRGKETPELRALLETQSHLAQACRADPASCGRGWTPLSRDAFNPIDRTSLQLEPTPATPLPAWLQRLKLPPDLPVRDDASLRAMFDFNTKNIAGRQRFQAKLFECAAYGDIFDSTLVKYGAPSWLTAVVFQESACYPRAKSEVGAVGLWQFMPESARAYGLRVVDGEIDERLNPIKSTDAAIHFLTDLQRTLGAWDLVMAAYNMGPYAVLARLAQVGGNAGFWDLAHAGLLPEETAGYVPAIEAYALALQNLSRLQFSRDGKRLEATAEVSVKPGDRLSLIARAASTTTLHIRELNPEFLRDVVPEGEPTARVPDAESHRAQAFLESWSPDDNRDTCVPEDFDWGVKEFESSKFAKGCGQPASP
jgi:membrane-bound lytic murein transglycosylase D